MRVLLVEDDRELAGYVRKGLEEEGSGLQPTAVLRHATDLTQERAS